MAESVSGGAGGTGKVPQRSAIVVLTDGIDTKSRLTAPEVSAIASSIDVPVYIVAVMSPVDDPRNPDYGTGALSSGLTDLARWTGGDFFIALSPAHASIAARQIVAEMRNQYMIAFEASARATRPKRLVYEVVLNRSAEGRVGQECRKAWRSRRSP